MTNVVDQSAWWNVEPTADLRNIYLAWWDSFLYNKWLALYNNTSYSNVSLRKKYQR